MKKHLFRKSFLGLAICVGMATTALGQTVNLDWMQRSNGTKNYVMGRDATVDKDGNTYSTGQFTGQTLFYEFKTSATATLTAFGNNDAYIMKHNVKGELEWVKQLGYAKNFAEGSRIVFDPNSGLVVVLGMFNDSIIAYDPKNQPLAAKGGQDIFLTALQADGSVMWTKTYGGKNYEVAGGLAADGEGGLYVSGSFQDKVEWEPGKVTTSSGADDGFLLKLNIKDGGFKWVRNIVGGVENDIATAVAVNYKYLFVTGTFQGKALLDVTGAKKEMVSNGADDIFLAGLDRENGDMQWLQFFGAEDEDAVFDIAAENTSRYAWITGRFSGKTNFNFNGGKDFVMEGDRKGNVFIAKYEQGGGILWGKTFGGDSRDEGKKIRVDEKNNVYTMGEYLWNVDFNTGTDVKDTFMVRSPGQGVYVHKLDAEGVFQWVRVLEGRVDPSNSASKAGSVTAGGFGVDMNRGAIHVNGHYNNSIDFDPNAGTKFMSSAGNSDGFVLRLLAVSCANSATLTATACDAYTYNTVKYTASGNYNHVFKNKAGCDSTVTLVLTINKSAATTLTQTACDNFTFDAKSLTTSGTYTQNLKTTNGCDSIVTLNLTINKSNVQSVKQTSCDSFSLDKKLYYTKTGTYKQIFKTSKGCDSTINLDLVIHPSYANTVAQTACDKIEFAGETFTESGSYDLVLKTQNGCDSLVTLNLVVLKMDRSVTVSDKILTANAVGATYQWLDCDQDMAPLAGETKQFLKATRNGNYAVEIKKDVCTVLSACTAVTSFSTAIEEWNRHPISLYPNPADQMVVVDLGRRMQHAIVRVWNVLGQSVLEVPVGTETKQILNIRHLASGMYVVTVDNGSQQAQLKFVKN